MDDGKLRALEERVAQLEIAVKRAQADVNWIGALAFVVPVVAVIVARLYS